MEAGKLIPILILVVKIQIQNLFEKNLKQEVKLQEKEVCHVVKIYIQKVAREVRSSFNYFSNKIRDINCFIMTH